MGERIVLTRVATAIVAAPLRKAPNCSPAKAIALPHGPRRRTSKAWLGRMAPLS